MVGPVGSATRRERARRQSEQNDATILVDVIEATRMFRRRFVGCCRLRRWSAMGTRAAPVRVLHDAAMHTQRFV